MADGSNPFAALFAGPAAPSKPDDSQKIVSCAVAVVGPGQSLNEAAEDVFKLTLNPKSPPKSKLFFMKDLADALGQNSFDIGALDQAVLDYCVSLEKESPVLDYLISCYERSLLLKVGPDTLTIQENILRNVFLVLSQPDLFPEQNGPQQWLELMARNDQDFLKGFLNRLMSFIEAQEDSPGLGELFRPIIRTLRDQLRGQHLMLGNRWAFDAFLTMAGCPALAALLVSSSILNENSAGRDCEKTLLGSLFTCSCIPIGINPNFDFFDKPSRSPASVHAVTESNIWSSSQSLMERVYRIFYTLLKAGQEVQDLTRTWIGQVLSLNRARGQTWHSHQQLQAQAVRSGCVSDGFSMNFAAVLLQLCKPFCSLQDPKAAERMDKIDPTFCTRTDLVRLKDLNKETCLTVNNTDERPALPQNYSFSTELFYATHKALELGPKVLHGQMIQISQDFQRLQRAYTDAQQSGQSPVAEQIQERMDQMMSNYLCFKAVLLVPDWLNLQFEFLVSTSRWLCLKSTKGESVLSCIPEFCIGNIMDFVVFAHRFSPSRLEQGQLDQFLSLVVTFMGSPSRLKNPHLRAAMAEMLDCLMPPDRGAQPASSNPRDALFVQHPRAVEVSSALLHVFASIETTGQGVAFEQKFNYRRPMYAAMKYLWSLPVHRRQFKLLAKEAEEKMESATPPLFLQFVNLLINDAIYLLDEGLSKMAQLREEQTQRGVDGSWPELGQDPQQRAQREASYQHTVMLARFHNMMGRETIRILEMMTAGIRAVFVHPTMVDRVAAMLNYFLLHLVGPKKREFKVKDFGDYEFEPAELVGSICRIYVQLSPVESFCLAVSSDGRSYSPQLFQLAEDVLSRTGRGALISDWRSVAEKIDRLSSARKAEEESLPPEEEIPEEFLDPIMSTIMMHPVILPSSHVTVDRSTIARHLLSDQSDPFNRSPLTMEDVQPNEELKQRIQQWLAERKKSSSPNNVNSNSNSSENQPTSMSSETN